MIWISIVLAGFTAAAQDKQKKSDGGIDEKAEAAMAAYADAANFQTGGAIDLAIQGWQAYLKQHPDHEMASRAAHYLGVCYMQAEKPNYPAASDAFARALKDKKYDLREESLANRGWCLYASAGERDKRDAKKLKESINVYETLRKEFPKSRFLDRAIFYCGEAAYGLGDAAKAIAYYNELMAMPDAKESPLRCDALYARGVAQEDLDQFEEAMASFQQLLSSCEKNDLVTDVHLRLGDLAILRGEHNKAVASFDRAVESTESSEDKSYAIFRQAFALVQAERPAEAASKYELLLSDYPDTEYAAAATLASAQSIYRSGDIDEAGKRFAKVLDQNNAVAATEATHWLSRIAIDRGKPEIAAEVARAQIKKGLEGEFAMDVRLDLAESLSMNPKTVAESLSLFEQAYRELPGDKLAPRALYNAAFSALQVNDPAKALALAGEFISKFPSDTLLPDVKFVAAEGQLLTGKTDEAAQTYRELIASTKPDNVQRPVWVLRAATTANASGKFDEAIKMLGAEIDSLPQTSQKAEAAMLIGQAHMMAKRPGKAAEAFATAAKADPRGPRAEEATLMVGQAKLADGDSGSAIATWAKMIQSSPNTRMADQARYKLAQAASSEEEFDRAVGWFDEILASDRDPGLLPYALYGKAFALLQSGDHTSALASVETLIDKYKSHPLRGDAMLTRGITLRNLKRYDDARTDLETFLAIPPRGTNLGHALYELALIDQAEKEPAKAAEKLNRLVAEVPGYPSMDKVLYELGWSLQEAGDDDAAVKHFTDLVTKYPDTSLVADASFFIGQQNYSTGNWDEASKRFEIAAKKSASPELGEKSLYRLGWSRFKSADYDRSEKAFAEQAKQYPEGRLSFDALMMVGESRFKQADYANALAGYEVARQRIVANDDTSKKIRDGAERQVRELTLLHGGQSAAQLKQWDVAIQWYDEMRKRFPSSDYLPQVFYETGFAYQQKQENDQSLKFFGEVADNYRNELAARARFMMGEIYFGDRKFDKAIPEFQRVMFGFGADKAPEGIKNWQAKSGFEAGRCSELLAQMTKTAAAKEKAAQIAAGFYNYVAEKHPDHELAAKSRERLEAQPK
ncbi:tetratricopeptide repeat protein [Rubripirellula tenax]|uniref:tetratricopeptide repeat protein n=1 Tax=Rubripirellula tenax TaxID=2528015 RepID=UPI001FE72264|nr:tetratricopeptide repeat protein [Rubripirellula tenax]